MVMDTTHNVCVLPIKLTGTEGPTVSNARTWYRSVIRRGNSGGGIPPSFRKLAVTTGQFIRNHAEEDQNENINRMSPSSLTIFVHRLRQKVF